MKKSVVRKMAKEYIKEGKNHQETFDAVYAEIKEQPETIAKIVRYVPTLEKRWKYKNWRAALIIILIVATFLQLLGGLLLSLDRGAQFLPIILLAPAIKIILVYGIVNHRSDYYKASAFLGLIGVVRALPELSSNFPDPWLLINLSIVAISIGISFYLHTKMVATYEVVKEKYTNAEGKPKLRNVIKLAD